MKTKLITTITFALLSIAATAIPAQRPSVTNKSADQSTTQAEKEKKMTHKELKTLIQNARTPSDHKRIAAYYREEAADLRNKSDEHRDTAEAYVKGTLYEPPKGEWLQHCRNFAAYFDKAAKEADTLASMHEAMAKQPE